MITKIPQYKNKVSNIARSIPVNIIEHPLTNKEFIGGSNVICTRNIAGTFYNYYYGKELNADVYGAVGLYDEFELDITDELVPYLKFNLILTCPPGVKIATSRFAHEPVLTNTWYTIKGDGDILYDGLESFYLIGWGNNWARNQDTNYTLINKTSSISPTSKNDMFSLNPYIPYAYAKNTETAYQVLFSDGSIRDFVGIVDWHPSNVPIYTGGMITTMGEYMPDLGGWGDPPIFSKLYISSFTKTSLTGGCQRLDTGTFVTHTFTFSNPNVYIYCERFVPYSASTVVDVRENPYAKTCYFDSEKRYPFNFMDGQGQVGSYPSPHYLHPVAQGDSSVLPTTITVEYNPGDAPFLYTYDDTEDYPIEDYTANAFITKNESKYYISLPYIDCVLKAKANIFWEYSHRKGIVTYSLDDYAWVVRNWYGFYMGATSYSLISNDVETIWYGKMYYNDSISIKAQLQVTCTNLQLLKEYRNYALKESEKNV